MSDAWLFHSWECQKIFHEVLWYSIGVLHFFFIATLSPHLWTLPSTTYKVTTRIYVKEDSSMETGEYAEVTLLNAANLVAAAHVTSRSGTGFWTISASMPDLSRYACKTLVVYEDIAGLDDVQAAVENNLYNESQSIHLPVDVGWRIKGDANMKFIRSGWRTGMVYDLYAAFPFVAVSEHPFPQKKPTCPIWYDTGIQQDWKIRGG